MGIPIFISIIDNLFKIRQAETLTAAVNMNYTVTHISSVFERDILTFIYILKSIISRQGVKLVLRKLVSVDNDNIGRLFRFNGRLRRLFRLNGSRFGRLLHRLNHCLVRKRGHRQQSEHHREQQQPYKKTLRILTRSGSVHFILFLSLKVRVMGSRPSLHKPDNSQCYFTGKYFTAFTMRLQDIFSSFSISFFSAAPRAV